MASLDELLALLPDNDSGAISPADMREIVTELWNYTYSVQSALNDGAVATGQAIGDLDDRVSALEGAP